MKIYIISLNKEKRRRSFQIEQMKQLSLDFEFFDAITTKDISEYEFKDKSYDWVRPLKRVELACYLSHQALWKNIAKSNEPALILEDDALITSTLPKTLKWVKNLDKIDYVDLETHDRKKVLSKKIYHQLNGLYLRKLYQKSSGAAGYILWPAGAEKLLELEREKGVMIADVHIAQCRSLKSFQLEPCPVIQLFICPSYGIEFDGIQKMQNSTTLTPKREESSLLFKLKRIIFEIKKGLRRIHLAINPLTTRRLPTIQPKDFYKS